MFFVENRFKKYVQDKKDWQCQDGDLAPHAKNILVKTKSERLHINEQIQKMFGAPHTKTFWLKQNLKDCKSMNKSKKHWVWLAEQKQLQKCVYDHTLLPPEIIVHPWRLEH